MATDVTDPNARYNAQLNEDARAYLTEQGRNPDDPRELLDARVHLISVRALAALGPRR